MAEVSVQRINFDTQSYEDARLEGLESYRRLREAIAAEGVQRKDLLVLPSSVAELSLRNLACLAGQATWGGLEIFFHEPTLPGSKTPASEPLRTWYQKYLEEFEAVFPEHRRLSINDVSAETGDLYTSFPERLERDAWQYMGELTDRPRPVQTLGVLLRDYAPPLRPMAIALGYSLDGLMRTALDGYTQRALQPVLDEYSELVEEEIAPAGPEAMFAAHCVVGIPELEFQFPRRAIREILANLPSRKPSPTALANPTILGHANSDLPTDRDEIGVAPLVEGLRELLNDKRTGLSLSIGITAPWGGGKSSVMSQLRKALTREQAEGGREWIPIRFDAWKYERSERLWAALSKAIYEQPLERMDAWEQIRFKFSLERERRGWLAFWGRPALLLGLLVALGILLASGVAVAAGIVAFALTLIGLGSFVATVWGLLTDPFKRALDGYTSDPSYEEQLGFTSDADADIRELTKHLTENGNRALVVFVDDLDRCSPRHVVEAVEAINQIFNASEDGRCVFILGMDRDMIAAGIEVAYADTVAKLPQPRRQNFGLHFLAKLVQISVAVPSPGQSEVERLLASIQASGKKPEAVAPNAAPSNGSVAEIASEEPSEQEGSLDAQSPSTPGPPPELETLDQPTADLDLLDQSSPEFREAERLAVQYLDPNPREVKRFDNAFRLQLLVARRTPGCELDFGEDDLVAVGSWVAMRLRWPDLAVAIDQDGDLLGRLEAAANGGGPSEDEPWCADPGLISLLQEPEPGRRIARLQERTFLRIS